MPNNSVVFNLMNRAVLDYLVKKGATVLPHKNLVKYKDKQWNMKLFTSKIIRGLELGRSIDDIIADVLSIVGNNEMSAIRNIRTMITGAENGGRLDSYRSLAKQGVIQKKEWMATPDDRTRPSHIDIDGEERDIEKPFSNGCMFPGDGKGPADEVWMCRCTMTDKIIGFRQPNGKISYVEYPRRQPTVHDRQMSEERKLRSRDKGRYKGGKSYGKSKGKRN